MHSLHALEPNEELTFCCCIQDLDLKSTWSKSLKPTSSCKKCLLWLPPVQVKSIFNSSIRAVRTSWSVKAPEIIRCFRACTASILSSTVPCYPKSFRRGITVFQYNLLTRALMPPKPARSKLNHTFVLYWCSEHSAQSWNTASNVFFSHVIIQQQGVRSRFIWMGSRQKRMNLHFIEKKRREWYLHNKPFDHYFFSLPDAMNPHDSLFLNSWIPPWILYRSWTFAIDYLFMQMVIHQHENGDKTGETQTSRV